MKKLINLIIALIITSNIASAQWSIDSLTAAYSGLASTKWQQSAICIINKARNV
ncbi:MAG: hypothetical protein IPP71_13480 [Bacteroidetes bacterium]|nr:hypothetical protein [Bacteroidota bacterium]